MNIRKRIAAIFLAVASIFGVLALAGSASAAPVKAPAASTGWNYTNCAQSQGFGARICLDETTGYGPVIYIYTSATGLYGAYSVSGGGSPVGCWCGPSTVWAPSETYPGSGYTLMSGGGAQTFNVATFANTGLGQQNLYVAQNVADLVSFFSADPNYEFITAT